MKKLLLLTLLFAFSVFSQTTTVQSERFPIFPNCQSLESSELENCFYNQVNDFVFSNFEIPQKLKQANFTGKVIVLFEVSAEGDFKVQYVDAVDEELVAESRRTFSKLPKVAPPTYNGKPTYSKYTITIHIPLKSSAEIATERQKESSRKQILQNTLSDKAPLKELDTITYKKFDNPQYTSRLNIPFSHSYYAQFDDDLNKVGANNHTSSKPYTYNEVNRYYDCKIENNKIQKSKSSWWGKKIWNEHFVQIQGEDYWFTVNPILDVQGGRSNPSAFKTTFVNTRGIQFNGGIGKMINFSTTVFESQGRFADYFNNYAESLKPDGGNPAIIPGIGIAKEFRTDAYDFPMAEANLAITPSKFFNANLGYGRNFIGDGYRSLFLSDGASPYPYVKLNTTFWKIKYTNLYTWLKDVRPEVTVDRTYATKYVASHYLSLNVTNRWNLGLFESVVWTNTNNRGFDMNFLNPIIFYRAVEFSSSARSGNALLGLTSKYKFNNQINVYGQFLIDEFSVADVTAGNKSWKNKFGFQIGAKYYNAFTIKNLLLQAEYNHVRPYVYAHSDPITNYAHNNQSLGHQWGGNFKEVIFIARYFKGRYFADAKLTIGQRGLDFDTPENNFNYGSNIYKDYEDLRPFDENVVVGQGNKTNILIADFQAGYLVNPATNLKLFGSFIYRNFNPTVNTITTFKESTSWFSLGLRCDIFNWYFDY
jgi:hypothetical protein